MPPRGLINVHASLLPRWRGAAPIHRAIQAGDTVTGVTIMRVVLALDAGAMLSRIEVPIDPEVTSDALEAVLANAGARLLVDTLDRMERGVVEEVPQDETLVTYAAKLQRADGELDWSRSATALHNQIRGLHPRPMASAMFRGKRVIIRASRVSAQPVSSATPGAIVGISDDGIAVATGDGVLDIVEIQPESRAPMRARDFKNGMQPRVGEQFSRVTSA
jgi:methionyl-tRNA formyltransferase